MSRHHNHNNPENKADLDAFLTALEAKMRGPYSSLELAKVISTPTLRGTNVSPQDYLHRLSLVLSRTDKMTQLRTLVGLLGLEPGTDTDSEIYHILTQAQESPAYEEWVRVVAGLARGVIFVDNNNNDNSNKDNTRESCRGEEASTLLDKTCWDIVQQTRELEQDNQSTTTTTTQQPQPQQPGKQQQQALLETADMYPLFVSYRYSLLDSELLDRVIPEQQDNPHFQLHHTAEILQMDDRLEKAKAEEAQEHKLANVAQQAMIPGAASAAAAASSKSKADVKQSEFPGFKPLKKNIAATTTTKTPPNRPKSSMFMPTKRPGMATAGRGGRPIPTKGSLHTRRAGAAQALLGKNRGSRLNTTGTATGGGASSRTSSLGVGGGVRGGTSSSLSMSSASMGRAQKLANSKSKMKMIDVTEVQGLNKEHKQRDDKIAKEESKEQKLLARKRKIMEAAAEKGLVALPKIRKLEEAVRGEQQSQSQSQSQPTASNNNNAESNLNANATENLPEGDDDDDPSSNQEWQVILEERSNKLSDEDRVRVQQFFTNRYNPTPDQPVYKMKLHEERTTDPVTGQAMKETYYLELDYASFTSKQSKKTKRY